MKNLTLAIIILTLGATLQAQTVNDKQLLYEKKINTYTNMRYLGLFTAMTSGICLISGIALYQTDGDIFEYHEFGPSSLTTGGILIITGALLTVPAIIFTVAGTKKIKYYSEKLENLDIGLLYMPEQKGISICYRF